jgi:hypothetical protein
MGLAPNQLAASPPNPILRGILIRFTCRLLLTSSLLLVCGGCVERTLDVRSDPSGALVYLNDQEIGRTPLSKHFLWYGTYDVQVRKDGYETLKTKSPVIAPWWQWIPFDFVAELVPVKFRDPHTVSYSLKPLSHAQIDPQAIVLRAQDLRDDLESSRIHPATTKPTTRK